MDNQQITFKNSRIKFLLGLWAVLFVLITAAGVFAADQYPRPTGMAVNDFARVIDAENKDKMENLAREILEKTGAAVVVVTMPELGPNEEISLYVNGLYKAWGIGKKGVDKGVLIFYAVKTQDIRVETGYGVEGILPDGLIGEILDKYVVPHVKKGETGKAMFNAMLACGAYIAKDAGVKLTGVAGPQKKRASPALIIIILICAAFLLGTRTGREMLPWVLLILMSGGRGGGDRDGGFGGFDGFGGGASGGGGAGRDF